MKIKPGAIGLLKFPNTDLNPGKLRPVLVLKRPPENKEDLMICAITSQLNYYNPEWNEMITHQDADFKKSGLKTASVIRSFKLATIHKSVIKGLIGEISHKRLLNIYGKYITFFTSIYS
jgi:mRNA interferase MazF